MSPLFNGPRWRRNGQKDYSSGELAWDIIIGPRLASNPGSWGARRFPKYPLNVIIAGARKSQGGRDMHARTDIKHKSNRPQDGYGLSPQQLKHRPSARALCTGPRPVVMMMRAQLGLQFQC